MLDFFKTQDVPDLAFQIHSIKCSVKLGQKVKLETVIDYCRNQLGNSETQIVVKTYPNFIVLHQKCVVDGNKKETCQHWYKSVKYTLFKYSEKQSLPAYYRQHCNISGLRLFSHIVPALDLLGQWLQLDTEDLHLEVDNLIATTKLPKPINKFEFLKKNPQVKAHFQFERFPAIILKPKLFASHHLESINNSSKKKRRKRAGPAILLYSSGSAVISGGKSENDLEKACTFLALCFAKYQA